MVVDEQINVGKQDDINKIFGDGGAADITVILS
jgi:hypothetical protein